MRKNPVILLLLVFTMLPLLSACSNPAVGRTLNPTPSESTNPLPNSTVTASPRKTAEPAASRSETPSPTPTPEPTPSPTPTQIDGPDKIGLYKKISGSSYRRIEEVAGRWTKGRDLCDLYAFASNEDIVKGRSTKDIFETNWHRYPDWQQYKIGYHVQFTLKSSEAVTLTIRSPKDAPKDPKAYFYQYVEVYLYDNLIPKTGPKRMHLVESKMKKGTMLTSIKLTAGKKFSEVTAITLTAFVYKDDGDFDPVTGVYTGGILYGIPIRQK
jgi:hypothetical protein